MSMGQALAATVTLQMLSGMGVLEYGTTLPRNHPQRFLFVNSRALMDDALVSHIGGTKHSHQCPPLSLSRHYDSSV